MQERALEKAGKLPPHKFKFDRIGFEFLLRKPRVVVPGVLVVICILLPLLILVSLALFSASPPPLTASGGPGRGPRFATGSARC